MEFTSKDFLTLDDMMREVISILLSQPFNIESTRSVNSGPSSELIAVNLRLANPRARISRTDTRGKIFSAIAELLWYLTKDNSLDFISHYIPEYKQESDDQTTIYGGYGPRLFTKGGRINQIENVIELLRRKPTSRQAVVQLFDAEDLIGNHKSVPCTTTLQFLIRDDRLNMITTMRSNDAYLGLPHDVFAFTMLQEIIGCSLGIELGYYNHFVGSLHLYEKNIKNCQHFLAEGIQSTKNFMPSMPMADPISSINSTIEAERNIRKGTFDITKYPLADYWLDLIRLIQIENIRKQNKLSYKQQYESISSIFNDITEKTYRLFVQKKLSSLKKKIR